MSSDLVFDNSNYILDKKACAIYGYSPSYVRDLCNSGILAHITRDGSIFVSDDALKAHKLKLLSAGASTKPISTNLEPLTGKMLPVKILFSASKSVKQTRFLGPLLVILVFVVLVVCIWNSVPLSVFNK